MRWSSTGSRLWQPTQLWFWRSHKEETSPTGKLSSLFIIQNPLQVNFLSKHSLPNWDSCLSLNILFCIYNMGISKMTDPWRITRPLLREGSHTPPFRGSHSLCREGITFPSFGRDHIPPRGGSGLHCSDSWITVSQSVKNRIRNTRKRFLHVSKYLYPSNI